MDQALFTDTRLLFCEPLESANHSLRTDELHHRRPRGGQDARGVPVLKASLTVYEPKVSSTSGNFVGQIRLSSCMSTKVS